MTTRRRTRGDSTERLVDRLLSNLTEEAPLSTTRPKRRCLVPGCERMQRSVTRRCEYHRPPPTVTRHPDGTLTIAGTVYSAANALALANTIADALAES